MKSISLTIALMASLVTSQQTLYGQCGGQGWTGQTSCASGSTCQAQNAYYSQCLPGAAATTQPPAATTQPPAAPTTIKPPAPSTTGSIAPVGSGKVQFAGVNIAGFDFGCATDGTCTQSGVDPPLAPNGNDGIGQMQHFVRDDGMNIFRLPVAWQYLVSSPGEPLIASNIATYDKLVQGCLNTGSACVLDIHNYARWNGQIIGQGGPSDDEFADTWSQLAAKYAGEVNIIFGIMNEPHDVPDINTWGLTVQAAVDSIRKAGATSQLILLPSNGWTSAATLVSDGSGAALLNVKNPDGSIKGLIFDVHKYLDSDSSGTNPNCVTDNVDVFTSLASWLRSKARQALLTETGGGTDPSCLTALCSQTKYLNANSDVYLGYIGWAAGNFQSGYVLDETPTLNGATWTDTTLLKTCLAR